MATRVLPKEENKEYQMTRFQSRSGGAVSSIGQSRKSEVGELLRPPFERRQGLLDQLAAARVVTKSVILRIKSDEDQHAGPSLQVSFEPGERLILIASMWVVWSMVNSPARATSCCATGRDQR